MERIFYSIIFCFLLFMFIPAAGRADPFFVQDTSKQDTIESVKPDFSKVDVVVEYDWSEPERNNGVDVFVNKESGKPTAIIMIKSQARRCEVELISGVVVKIIDPTSKKVLKIYKAGNE